MEKKENEKVVELNQDLNQTQEAEVEKKGGFREFIKANKKIIIKGTIITLGVGAGIFIFSKLLKKMPIDAIDILENSGDILTEIEEVAQQVVA